MENYLSTQKHRSVGFIWPIQYFEKAFKNHHQRGLVELEILLWTGIFMAFLLSLIQIHTKAMSFHQKQLEDFSREWNGIQ